MYTHTHTALCPRHTLSNGTVTYSMSDHPPVGTVVTYSCDTGYDLTGSRMRICVDGIGWTGSSPACNSERRKLKFMDYVINTV